MSQLLTPVLPCSIMYSSLRGTDHPRQVSEPVNSKVYRVSRFISWVSGPGVVPRKNTGTGPEDRAGFSFHKGGPGKCRKHEPEPNQHRKGTPAMTSQDTTNTTPDNATAAPDLWCTSCGCHLDVYVQNFSWKSITKFVVMGTCRNTACPMYNATLGTEELCDADKLVHYGALPVYDIFTGIVLVPVDQQLANQIAWLMMHADAEQIAAFERYTAHHSNDDDYAQMVGAFVEGIQDAPDNSVVCDLHLAGR